MAKKNRTGPTKAVLLKSALPLDLMGTVNLWKPPSSFASKIVGSYLLSLGPLLGITLIIYFFLGSLVN